MSDEQERIVTWAKVTPGAVQMLMDDARLASEQADFDGETYEPIRDRERLTRQLDAVRQYLQIASERIAASEHWRTLAQIAAATAAPQASVSARLRDLRKAKFGGYLVQRQYAGDGLWEYRLVRPPVEQGRLGL